MASLAAGVEDWDMDVLSNGRAIRHIG